MKSGGAAAGGRGRGRWAGGGERPDCAATPRHASRPELMGGAQIKGALIGGKMEGAEKGSPRRRRKKRHLLHRQAGASAVGHRRGDVFLRWGQFPIGLLHGWAA
ncbi:hypothetical protein R5R35_009927 [Gryllus longicercus]|uniref:Uncharacterized protein n=1 Tax=Gryllus longicercus TaxID=2509291 RepID=A0AAN9Z2B7_9ORTH